MGMMGPEVTEKIKQVLKDPEDKRYKVRVDVTMELDRKEFLGFLVTRDAAIETLKSRGMEFGIDSEYFKQAFLCGCQVLMQAMKSATVEVIANNISTEKFQEFLLKLMEENADDTKNKDE